MTDFHHSESYMIHNNATSFVTVDNEKTIEITQHLAPEQFLYEFPPKSHIIALEANDDPNEFSFFDECSFISNSTFMPVEEELDHYFDTMVADHQLSPLQLPTQVNYYHQGSCDSNGTIVRPARPSSFLSSPHRHHVLNEQDSINWDETSFIFPDYSTPQQQQQQHDVHPFSRRNSYNDDLDSHFSSQSKVIFMKISKTHVSPPTFIHYSQGNYISTDEGYDDNDKELPIESASFFLPLSDRDAAATKIQRVWRGYRSRRLHKTSPAHVLAGLAQVSQSIHRRDLKQLQRKLESETAMRRAFEKTMEDMTVLMDHQHAVLHERLEREVSMRNMYEQKMEHALAQIQPLEARLRHETKARAELESMMSRVIDELQALRVQVRDQAKENQTLQQQMQQQQSRTTTKATVRSTTPTTTRASVRSITPSSKMSTRSITPSKMSARSTTPSITPARSVPSRMSVRSVPSSNTPVRNVPSRMSVRSSTTKNTVSKISNTQRLATARPFAIKS